MKIIGTFREVVVLKRIPSIRKVLNNKIIGFTKRELFYYALF